MVDKIVATDPHTVVIHLKFATSAFLPALADPYNWIYQKKILDQDSHWALRAAASRGWPRPERHAAAGQCS
jgi:ABC-type transport system substrate-binding protein